MQSARPWREAWHDALYGHDGFFLREEPAAHFRTSVHASTFFAEALIRLARDRGLRTVVDLGSGGGELLTAMREHSEPGELELVGVDIARRPLGLAADIEWLRDVPPTFDGLLVANEWLDNVVCDVVQLDPDAVVRFVLVDPETGDEQLGEPCSDPWLSRWWPLDGAGVAVPGLRAEVGSARDDAWSAAVDHLGHGVAVAVDYGHLLQTRPPLGSLRSYRDGHEVSVRPDGSRDVTAHVAVDAVAARVGGLLQSQREALAGLGVAATWPDAALAARDPLAYVEALSRAGEAVELTACGGLGELWWITTER